MNATVCATIVHRDDGVLSHVHQTAGQVTCVGSFQRGVGQTLTGTVGGDEVFQHGQALLKVRFDGGFDHISTTGGADLGGLVHQPTHSTQLFDLILGSTSTGFIHHIDGVQAVTGI